MPTRDPQDELLIVEALVQYGHDHADRAPARSRQAWNLAAEIAADHDLTLKDVIWQIE